jgi:L-iditol 2-dehydrogenase
MRAVAFDVSIPGFVLAKTAGQITDSAFFGSLSGLRIQDLPEPDIPGPDWVKVEVVQSGICGSDIGCLTYSASPSMEPFGSFPAVLGHEIVGTVKSLGGNVDGLARGQRVTIDPMISCATRGYGRSDFCPSWSRGLHCTCERAGEKGLTLLNGKHISPGVTIGYHSDLPGGWGEVLLAHKSQVFAVDDNVSDDMAVLVEPLSIAMHAVLGTKPHPESSVMVLGSGTIALATIWALRATGHQGLILSQVKRVHEKKLAQKMGATEVVFPGQSAIEALLKTGAKAYKPIIGKEVFSGGGFSAVYDCVGNSQSLQQAMKFASPRGKLAMIGCVGKTRNMDLTMLWARELNVQGFVGYGLEEWEGGKCHTFEVVQSLLGSTGNSIEEIITHKFSLEDYCQALKTSGNHRESGAVKVLLRAKR